MKKSVGKALESALKERDETERDTSTTSRVFSNKHRRRIFSVLTHSPCLSVSKISQRVGVSNNSVSWHIDKLIESGYLIERGTGRRRMFWPDGLVDTEDTSLFCTLSNETARGILLMAIESPGISQKELSGALDVSHQGISSWAKQLKGHGLINAVAEGVHIRYYPTTYLSRRSDENYERTKAFKKVLVEKLKSGGENPKTIKASRKAVMLEIGPKSDRSVLDIGLDPFLSVLEIDAE